MDIFRNDKETQLATTENVVVVDGVVAPAEVIVTQALVVTDPRLEQITNALVKNVAATTRRIYRIDANHFCAWLSRQHLAVLEITFEDMSEYRAYLSDNCKNKATAARRMVIARRMLEVAVILKLRTDNPAEYVRGFPLGQQETTHHTVDRNQARTLLNSIDRTTAKGKRDYSIISLLFRTGIRRAEAAALTLGDLSQEQGHHIAMIQHGKGDKRRVIKLPVDVRRTLDEYLETVNRVGAPDSAPLFIRFKKGDHFLEAGLDGRAIERIVAYYATPLGLELTPHGLRASFITEALKNGAKLEQVQYAVGHTDPRTTERYQKHKLNLDSNAVDFVFV